MDGKMGCGGWWGSLWDIRNEGEGKVVAALLSKQPHAFFFFLFKLLAFCWLGSVQCIPVCSGSFYEPLSPLFPGSNYYERRKD